MEENKTTKLPENAHRELKPGEEYQPLLSPNKNYPEVTPWSVSLGLIMTILFSAAAAYLGLKVGQVFEAAIPIAIIAVGLSTALKRKNALGENVIIQSIGSCSGAIVAGAIFTLPALFMLQEKYPELTVNFTQIFFSSLLGGVLGILFLIPFRKYFVKEQHGKYPFPEATATTQVLVSGESGGKGAKTLLISGLIGGLYDFIVSTFGLWGESLSSKVLPLGSAVADKAKVLLKVNTGAAVLGLGFIVGLKYAFIICCGSFLIWLVAIPLINVCFGTTLSPVEVDGIQQTISQLDADTIFKEYGRHLGIGAIAAAGIIGIIKSFGVIKSALGLAANEFKRKKGDAEQEVIRTQRDISMKIIVIGLLVTILAVLIFFAFGVVDKPLFAVIGVLLVGIIAFLFTTVAANATAIVGSNPVSGMTIMTLILGSLVLVSAGLKGTAGMTAALIIGGVVCTALSVAGAFITDLKVGYWVGSTPRKQETWKFLGTLVAAATVGGVMIILNKTYGFAENSQLAAPQANAMKAVIEPMMNGGSAPWLLYGIGAAISIILTYFKVPALPFALGMFIPLELNMPMLIGGAIAWYVGSRSKDQELNEARVEKGTLIASGFIAGGALMGVVSAILRFAEVDLFMEPSPWTEPIAIIPYLAIIIYMGRSALKAKKL